MLVEIVGSAGAICLLLAYFLVSARRISSSSSRAHLLNLAGAGMLGVNNLYHGAFPPAALNVLWALIALTAIAKQVFAPGGGDPP
jgi:hypothetical protein